MRNQRVLIAVVGVLTAVFLSARMVWAHPLGNFTVNHYAGLSIISEAIAIDYVLDMAEIPAFQEISGFDDNDNGQADADETVNYHPAQCEMIRSNLALSIDGQAVTLVQETSAIEFPPGVGGLVICV